MSGTPRPQTGPNFAFLARHDRSLVRMSAYAELYCHSDPNTAFIKLRQFVERIAQLMAARFGLETELALKPLIDQLAVRGIAKPDVAQKLHYLRELGNEAVHHFQDDHARVVHAIKTARVIGAWYHRTVAQPGFRLPPFVEPQRPDDEQQALRDRLAELESEIRSLRDQAANAEERAALEEELRHVAEDEARARQGDADAALALAEETTNENERFKALLGRLQAEAVKAPESVQEELFLRSQEAAVVADLDEADTRFQIDLKLRQAGWQADSTNLRYARGSRPQKGRNMAIAEWPTRSGPADYVLFLGLVPVAVIEAKRRSRNVAGAIEQAKRYARDLDLPADLSLADGAPWGQYRVPFLFASNGREFLRQLLEESGIWFLDARQPSNHPRALEGWYTPEGLSYLLQIDAEEAERKLAESPTDYLPLREYQHDAIAHVEQAIARGQRDILVAMATGTGKTRTCIALLYRLIKAKRFRRALFMVDRSALGEQADDVFRDVRLEANKTFAEIYDVKSLGDVSPDSDTRLQIATVQSLVKRILYDETSPLPIDAYDVIVIDECHRGYTLDREMGDQEIRFRDQADYISKYRRVLDHFDAVRIGLTATPALHTTEIFGLPVFVYSYRQAVIDGFLVDHDPPEGLGTRLATEGIHWEAKEQVKVYDPERRQIELFQTPDEIDVGVEDFNKKVITESFNRVVCQELARRVDPMEPGKTLVFCVDDRHADLVVRLLKEAFAARFGSVDDDAVQKITGAADRPLERIRHLKNERFPSVAVTVDLLTTGIDVPSIVNLVFIRRVQSRILYDQMLGRATRPCEDLYGRGEDKESFRIYDPVRLYDALKDLTDMKPVVVSHKTFFQALVDDLFALTDDEARQDTKDQILAKLQRKKHVIRNRLAEPFETAAGMDVDGLLAELSRMSITETVAYFRAHPRLADLLDRHIPREGRRVLISDHEDELLSVERGYGKDRERPADYLESFGRFVEQHVNDIPALLVVTQRPRELTREQLKALKLALDAEGYSERHLRLAWSEWKNEDIAASIIGFIRQRALGEPLRPYEQRVDEALARILASRDWVPIQRKWLERIGKQMKLEVIVDREALDRGQFREQAGGFDRMNKLFDGRLDDVLGDLHDEVWKRTA